MRGTRLEAVWRSLCAGLAILSLCALSAENAFARTHIHSAHRQIAPKAAALIAPYAAACLMESTTGQTLLQQNMHQPWPAASLAKMMLMVIVARKLDDGSLKLADRITTSRNAARMGGSQVYLKEGETFSLDDMMKAVVVHSANDASVAVAEYIAGSTGAFVQMMNQDAVRLGMKDTHYYSVDGLPPGPGEQPDVSSAYDLALLARALVGYPQILRWSSISTSPFRNGAFELRNTNHLVRTYPGCDGLKTGFYYKAGFNVVATADRNSLRLIAVVLGSPRKAENFKQAAVMLSQGFANYEMYSVARRGTTIPREVAIGGGVTASVMPVWGKNVSIFLPREARKDRVKIAYEIPSSLPAPIKIGQKLGTANVTLDGMLITSADLIAPDAIAARPSLLYRVLGLL
ncbi:MAG: D-alanyl-D-alanine carboxypeptidase family protein [Candidatus Binataceae bacterium]